MHNSQLCNVDIGTVQSVISVVSREIKYKMKHQSTTVTCLKHLMWHNVFPVHGNDYRVSCFSQTCKIDTVQNKKYKSFYYDSASIRLRSKLG